MRSDLQVRSEPQPTLTAPEQLVGGAEDRPPQALRIAAAPARGSPARSPPPPATGARTASTPSTASGRRCRRSAESRAAARGAGRRTAARAPRAAGDSGTRAIRAPTARAGGSRRAETASNACSRIGGSADSAGITNANRALRSGFCVRSSCVCRISSQPGTSRTASSSAIAISSGSANVRPGNRLLAPPHALEPRDARRASARCRERR